MIVYKYVGIYKCLHIFYFRENLIMKPRKFEIIDCPKCGYEYLPAEIFVPKFYFGIPENIERGEDGKIISYEGTSVDLFEKYICDRCGTEFRVASKLQLTTNDKFPDSFDDDYFTKLNPNLFLKND